MWGVLFFSVSFLCLKPCSFQWGKVFSFYSLNALVIKPYFVTITP
ncbi:putative lipoprotein [Helicobacter pylori R32b]|nr:putative lipoprotein [Helicobacter pylori R32b]